MRDPKTNTLLELLGRDLTFAEIAKRLRISEARVEQLVREIGQRGRAEATRLKAREDLERAAAQRDARRTALVFTPMSVSRDRLMAGR